MQSASCAQMILPQSRALFVQANSFTTGTTHVQLLQRTASGLLSSTRQPLTPACHPRTHSSESFHPSSRDFAWLKFVK
ncbi:hypothetical protein L211DRAFT_132774 [Terfezia boudieri ATCC MYA-4762]|uniref:Uncharacterized protein n=1 Tax=Terfezia boudieri ATCC MYA-4762 TaxID=1051890 RepID=A0A3N4LUW0_9PEZI|nr:hypothetical protein L211DRAFT_132774 [Terfezia boudieri ATCC MYA-4762]